MANIKFFRGGTPIPRYMWCAGDFPQFQPPHNMPNQPGTPPYDTHFDGVYGVGYFTGGMPIRPSLMPWQRHAMTSKVLAVGDIIQCILVPEDHYVEYINFKIDAPDAGLAGATVQLTAQRIALDADGEFIYTEMPDVLDALTAQGLDAPVPLDVASNLMVSLLSVTSSGSTPVTGTVVGDDVTGEATGDGSVSGYVRPLYAEPGAPYYIGLKIVSLPSNSDIKLHMALNGWYMSVKVAGFECPTQL